MRIKICGITREEDALFCAEQGVDFLGMVFVAGTPRAVDGRRAAAIAAVLGGLRVRPKLVGVFRDQTLDEVREIAARVPLDLVQLHGAEPEEQLRAIGVPAIKTCRVTEVLPDTSAHPSADWLLFDSGSGSGRLFDWSLLDCYTRSKPFFLAGGITPENVAAAVALVRPDGIDVSSGVEASPGVKDRNRIRALVERIRR